MFIRCESPVKDKLLFYWVKEKSLKERVRGLGETYFWIWSSNA